MKKLAGMLLALAMVVSLFGVTAAAKAPEYKNTKAAVKAMGEYALDYTVEEIDEDGDERVVLQHSGEVCSFEMNLFFTEDNEGIIIRVWDLITFDEAKMDDVIHAVNDLNNSYKLVRFYACPDNSVTASFDLIVREGHEVGDITMEAIARMIGIIEDAYPALSAFAA